MHLILLSCNIVWPILYKQFGFRLFLEKHLHPTQHKCKGFIGNEAVCILSLAIRCPEHREGPLLLPMPLPMPPANIAREPLIPLQQLLHSTRKK